MKYYLYQLREGKMVVFENNRIRVEETGYPYPDCRLLLGKKLLTSQVSIMNAILGYEVEDFTVLTDFLFTVEDMDFTDFKMQVYRDNIGGGCPDRLQALGVDILDNGLTFDEACFKSLLPLKYQRDICNIPFELKDYLDLVHLNWESSYTNPDRRISRFKGNILMYSGIKNCDNRYVDFIKLLICNCSEFGYFNYITKITTNSGISCIVVSDYIGNNEDLQYFYSKVSGVDLFDGFIDCEIDEDKATLSFCCTDDSQSTFYRNKKPITVSFERWEL